MSDEYNYNSQRQMAESWRDGVAAELTKQGHSYQWVDNDPSGKHADCAGGFQCGGALILLGVRENPQNKTYQPCAIVTEIAPRKQRVGIGQHHAYFPIANGLPNFKKLVKNMAERRTEIEAIGTDYTAFVVVTGSNLERQKEELSGVHIPPGMVLQRLSDGNYILHSGTAKLSLDQVKAVIAAFR